MKTILLIDDDHLVRKSFGGAIRRQGYHVLEAASGREGLYLARKHLPDLILSDINMPGGDGSTLLRDIRREPGLRSKQVVLMTGRPDLMSPRKGMDDGADDFLLKPFSHEALLNCLEARLSRSSVSWRVEEQVLTQLRSSVPAHLPHEFFTPMAGIIGLVEILRTSSSTLTPQETAEIHDDVYYSAVRLNRTLRNYLQILDLKDTLPELLSGSLSAPEVDSHITAGIETALKLHQRRKDIALLIDACSIVVKPEDLSRIVEELIDNACKFSCPGSRINLDMDANGRLTVTDLGKGLTSEEISQIGAFQQFNRERHEQQGLGLGLVLVQKLTAACGADFSITSQPGNGTQVQIMFRLSGKPFEINS